MGLFDRFLKRGQGRDRRDWDRSEQYDQGPEVEPSEIVLDHQFIFLPEGDYDRHIGTIAYRVRIENVGDYPIGSPKVDFGKGAKLGRFGKAKGSGGMVDPGKSADVLVQFEPMYIGGKEEFALEISFFDFKHRSEERLAVRTEPLKVTVPKFKTLEKDEDGYRFLTSNLYRWAIETEVMEISPQGLFEDITGQLDQLGFHKANEMVNESLFRGIRQFCATDDKGRKWAAQVQVIGKGKQSKLLLYTFGEKASYAYNLATRVLLKAAERAKVVENIVKPARDELDD